MASDPTAYITIPCYNEELRLRTEEFLRLARTPGVRLVMVNDGSSDGTLAKLQSLQQQEPAHIEVVDLKCNGGKAEAVRQGMLLSLGSGATLLGFLDADLSTPVAEAIRLAAELRGRSATKVVLASRVALLGYDIRRHAWRHYLGRIFATVASNALNLVVYDTQCGAKFFRASPTLKRALEFPFFSPWIFDVELIGRLLKPGNSNLAAYSPNDFLEVPLFYWEDVKGSKLGLLQMFKSGLDLIILGIRMRLR